MAGIRIEGNTSGNVAEVNASNEVKVALSTADANAGKVRIMSENDAGTVTGSAYLYSPETDEDYRLRVSQDTIFDSETFNYTAQNTGKHTYANTTMAGTWSAAGFTTNSGNITTTTTGLTFGTYAEFPLIGSTEIYCEMEGLFTAQPTSNTSIEFGLFRRGAANPYAPTDGVYFRLTSAGLSAVLNRGGVETTQLLTFTYTNSTVYQFMISGHERETKFWINDVLYARIATPAADGQPFQSATLPFSVRHAITGGAAGAALSFILKDYTVSLGGSGFTTVPSTAGNRILGSYQGLSGGTLGTLSRVGTITTGNEANVTAAVPTTTTAALGSGLGGTFWETVSLAVNTDGIIMSYQVPAGTIAVQGRRLVIRGIYLSSYVQTVVAGGPYVAEWFLAFGHTAVSLATTEAATTKAPRRITAPFVQLVTAAQAVSTLVSNTTPFWDLGDAPVYVNPGEFVQLCTRHIGTVGTTGTVVHRITPVYGWE
jgi:hypothetical protein